jgi:hypothetical protein
LEKSRTSERITGLQSKLLVGDFKTKRKKERKKERKKINKRKGTMMLSIAIFNNEGYKTGLLNFSNFSRLSDEF